MCIFYQAIGVGRFKSTKEARDRADACEQRLLLRVIMLNVSFNVQYDYSHDHCFSKSDTVKWGISDRVGNIGTLRPPSEIGPEVEDAQTKFIACFFNLKD